ncbi:hypothetical protein [Microcoleus sp. herbarium2]|uniref:hypothetical protein n=1 Tax=Microcoleus sp. herbarium2 TaxID=3055433 RepID=UPI002FD7283F
MPKNDATPEGRSQKLTSPDMVMIDRKTCRELGKLIGNSIDQLQTIRRCEIMLTSLEYHLSELADDRELDKSFDIDKGILLLKYWLDVVPGHQTEMSGWLERAFETLQVALAANELGRGNE